MISIIITSFKEPRTIGRAIEAIISQDISEDYELIVAAPDEETLNVARSLSKKNKRIIALKDSGEGKPSALNLVVSKAKGDILVLTDGDVYVGNGSMNALTAQFANKRIGAVSGRPISTSPHSNKYGFWSYMLTEIAHERRKQAVKEKKRFFCSGYLFAIRKSLFPKLPKELLSEDGYISHKVYKERYAIAYEPKATVYVKYPSNFSDWILQKKRSAGGYSQIRKITHAEIRSFKKESLGAFSFIRFCRGFREIIWIAELFFARLYLWYLINRDIGKSKKVNQKEIWKRVDSTK